MAQQDDEEKDDWHPCGVGWPHRQGEGFNLDVHWALAEGSRLVLMPPKTQGKPWTLYRVKPRSRVRSGEQQQERRSGGGGGRR